MRKSPSNDEMTIRNQFDRICKLVLKNEAIDYHRHMTYLQKHEVMLSELTEYEQNQMYTEDEYGAENQWFRVMDYDIEVKDSLIAEALQVLSERKHLENRIYFLQVFGAVEPCVKCAMTSCAAYFAPSWRKVTDIINEEIFKRILK